MLSGRTRWECVSAVCVPFGVTASMAILRFDYFDAILAALPSAASRQVCAAVALVLLNPAADDRIVIPATPGSHG
jgi:hypothetical protein